MSNVIQFPKQGEKIALYTDNLMFIGSVEESESINIRSGIWLSDAVVAPIKGQVTPGDVLHLASVLVMWDKVVALSACPEFAIQKQP